MRIDLFIFDWSGTVSDDRRTVYQAGKLLFKHFGRELMPYEQWLSKVTLTISDFLESQGIKGDKKEFQSLYSQFFDQVYNNGLLPEIYPDAYKTLKQLSGEKLLSVNSSHPEDNLIIEVRRYKLEPFFEIIKGDAMSKIKDIKVICGKLGVKPENTLYIGDTIYDVRHAKGAGALSGAVTTGYHSREMLSKENPDFLADSLSELIEQALRQTT